MFHFFGRMRGNGRKAAQDYRLLDYADHLRFIRPFVQARYGSEPAQEILSILKDSADDEWTYSRSRKALQPLTGRGDAEFLARVELMASEAIGGVNSAIGAERMRDADGTASPGVRAGRDEAVRLMPDA